VVWTIPSPWRSASRPALGAARLVSTPSPIGLPDRGLARDRHLTGFPDFEQFCVPGFPGRTQVVQVRCVYRSATPAFPAAPLTTGKMRRRPWPSPTFLPLEGEKGAGLSGDPDLMARPLRKRDVRGERPSGPIAYRRPARQRIPVDAPGPELPPDPTRKGPDCG
jgi:hypothetical protein